MEKEENCTENQVRRIQMEVESKKVSFEKEQVSIHSSMSDANSSLKSLPSSQYAIRERLFVPKTNNVNLQKYKI